MKNIKAIQLGEYEVVVEAERLPNHVVKFTATCRAERIESCMTLAGDHTHTPEQFQKDIEDHALLVAKEAAAKAHRENLLANLFTEPVNSKKE
jgi:hypothetical protein